MTSVHYIGRSSSRVLTVADWGSLGATAEHDTVWNWANGYSVPYSELTPRQLDVLAELDGFLPGQPDGPREYPLPPPNTQAGESAYFRAMRKLYRQAESLAFDQEANIQALLAKVAALEDTYDDDLEADDVLTVPRSLVTSDRPLISGDLILSYFTARKGGVRTKIRTVTGATAAGATPTVARMACYKIEANGTATLLATTAHDPTLFATAATEYVKDLSAPIDFQIGQRYAWAPLFVSTAALPSLVATGNIRYQLGNLLPRLIGRLAGPISDFPSSITPGLLPGSTFGRLYARFTTT